MSFLELVIALAVFVTIGLVMVQVVRSTPEQTRHQVLAAELEREALQGVDWIERHLCYAARDTLSWDASDPQNPYLVFRKLVIDDSTGVIGYTGAWELGFALRDELANGSDDNANGLIDEGELYMLSPDGGRFVLSGSVLAGSFEVVEPGPSESHLQLRFQLCRRYDPRVGDHAATPDSTGVYPASRGFVLRTVERPILVRN